MAQNHTKVNNTDLPTLIGQRVVVRYTADASERRGIVGANDATNSKVRIDQGKGHFWVSSINTPAHYIFVDNF